MTKPEISKLYLAHEMIYIDASRYNNTSKRTGVENYSYFLINALVNTHGKEICLITPRKIDLEVRQIIIPFARLWTHLRLSWEIFKTKNIDNIFVPSHVLPLICPKKSIITIHDVAFKYSPESYSFKSRWYLDWTTKFAVKKARKIIVPSKKTKEDLIEFYHCSENKIVVIPLGFEPNNVKVSESQTSEVLETYKIDRRKFLLYIGRIEVKKNSDTLIKAFAQFCGKNKDMKLIMAGFPGHGGEAILKAIPKEIKERLILPGYISAEEKQIFLQNARAFIFPSRQEGFGIPLLEAMDAELPIIASNIPTSKEIAGENALFFEVEDAQELAKLMQKVSGTDDPDTLKTGKHAERMQHYMWERCGEEVYRVIHG